VVSVNISWDAYTDHSIHQGISYGFRFAHDWPGNGAYGVIAVGETCGVPDECQCGGGSYVESCGFRLDWGCVGVDCDVGGLRVGSIVCYGGGYVCAVILSDHGFLGADAYYCQAWEIWKCFLGD